MAWRPASVLAALLLLSCDAPGAPDIAIGSGWTRETAPGQAAAAVYLTIENRGDGDDRLVEAQSRAASGATIHSSASTGGVARMRPIEGGLAIPAHGRVELKPGGTHIMLTGMNQQLRSGQTADLALSFARSGRKSIVVRVVPATAGAPPNHRGDH